MNLASRSLSISYLIINEYPGFIRYCFCLTRAIPSSCMILCSHTSRETPLKSLQVQAKTFNISFKEIKPIFLLSI